MKIIDAYLWELGFELYIKELLRGNIDKYPYVYNNYYYDRLPISIRNFNNKSKEEKENLKDTLIQEIENHLPKDGQCECGKVIRIRQIKIK